MRPPPWGAITREELQRCLSREDGSADFETGLNTAAHRLRVTLGDTAEKPRYIETSTRVGYRFIAPVNTKIEAPSDRRETPPDSFHFGILELRLHTGEPLKHGVKVNLQHRPLQFLGC
ncbi:MAG: winged helix-turn-helix domain-containing protein [Bryobacteraceae bacterium]|jgi:DNA-binding winged helix-turn-helix (wHTH) protein